MFLDYVHAMNPVIGLTINVLIQVLGFRYIAKLALLKSIFVGFFIGLVSIIVLEVGVFPLIVSSRKDVFPLLMMNLMTYSALGYCYFHFINLGETARRIRILRELYDAGEDGLSKQEILERYNAKHIVDMRISRLLRNGQIVAKEGKYYIGKPFVLLIARTLGLLKFIMLGKRMEFD